jgi:hypothetical protein
MAVKPVVPHTNPASSDAALQQSSTSKKKFDLGSASNAMTATTSTATAATPSDLTSSGTTASGSTLVPGPSGYFPDPLPVGPEPIRSPIHRVGPEPVGPEPIRDPIGEPIKPVGPEPIRVGPEPIRNPIGNPVKPVGPEPVGPEPIHIPLQPVGPARGPTNADSASGVSSDLKSQMQSAQLNANTFIAK